jgi:hypothetical protein
MTHSKLIDIPLYPATLIVCVSDDPADERKACLHDFGLYRGPRKFDGLNSYDNAGKFAIFLDRHTLSHRSLSHEIFHVTHRIMEYVGDRFTPRNQEPYAYLNCWITQQVYALCSAWRLKIKNKL